MASTKRIDSYGRSMMIKIIHDVMKSDWPEEFKKHLLLRELLWKSDSPKGVKGDNSKVIFSAKAKTLWKKNELAKINPKSGIIIEHAVPRLEIYGALKNKKRLTEKVISKILDRMLVRVAVTKEEDVKLNKLGLRQRMPENWEDNDILARHREANIKHVTWLPEKYKQTS